MAWVAPALETGYLPAIGHAADGGRLQGDTGRLATAALRRYRIRSPMDYDAALQRFHSDHWLDLSASDRGQLLSCMYRHADPGFAAVAQFRPALQRFLKETAPLQGGGGDAFDAAFDATFPEEEPVRELRDDERRVPHRGPAPDKFDRSVNWDDEEDSEVLSAWSDE